MGGGSCRERPSTSSSPTSTFTSPPPPPPLSAYHLPSTDCLRAARVLCPVLGCYARYWHSCWAARCIAVQRWCYAKSHTEIGEGCVHVQLPAPPRTRPSLSLQ
eukprot:1402444-Rhodomonas_salina.1